MRALHAPFTKSAEPPSAHKRALLAIQWRRLYGRQRGTTALCLASRGKGRSSSRSGESKSSEGKAYTPPRPQAAVARKKPEVRLVGDRPRAWKCANTRCTFYLGMVLMRRGCS